MPFKDRAARLAYQRAYYAKNWPLGRGGYREGNARYHGRVREKFLAYLRSHPCVDCGEDDPIVLDCDHRDPETKTFSVSAALRHKLGWGAISAELEKCDVRCANCHRRRTYHQQGGRHRGALATGRSLDEGWNFNSEPLGSIPRRPATGPIAMTFR